MRQKIRQAILLLSLLLFPVTIYYMSPYLSIDGALKGILAGSVILFAAVFFLSLFMGRIFCGWLCPMSGLQQACSYVNDNKVKGGIKDMIKFFIWFPWVLGLGYSFFYAGGIVKISPFYMTDYGISISSSSAYIIYYSIILLVTLPAIIIGKHAFCHYICWVSPFQIIGNKLRNIINIPGLRLKADPNSCNGCGKCSRECPMSLEVKKMVERNDMENSECIMCGKCVDGCNKESISFKVRRK